MGFDLRYELHGADSVLQAQATQVAIATGAEGATMAPIPHVAAQLPGAALNPHRGNHIIEPPRNQVSHRLGKTGASAAIVGVKVHGN
jgi:hypothetical protein